MDLSPEDQAKLVKCNEMMGNLSERMDALTARRAKRDAEKAQRKADTHLASEREELRSGALSKDQL